MFIAAAACYAANCGLGTAAALRLIDTRAFRWLHHALYIATATSTAAAVSSAWWGPPGARRAAVLTAPAVLPLAVVPFAGTRTWRHPLIALLAAPFLITGVIRSSRGA